MARPSRHVDRRLLAAGRELYPSTGAAGLSVRRIAEHAGANLGMFHYHFRNKETFVRALLQSLYEPMFAELTLVASTPAAPPVALRNALLVIARFVRDQRRLLRRLLTDALNGERPTVEFVRENFPRHVAVIVGLVAAGQGAGDFRPIPLSQALMFIAGAVAGPILLGSAAVESGLAPPFLTQRFEDEVLSDAALGERIDLVLAGLARPSREAA